jgi:hypothetical protein
MNLRRFGEQRELAVEAAFVEPPFEAVQPE